VVKMKVTRANRREPGIRCLSVAVKMKVTRSAANTAELHIVIQKILVAQRIGRRAYPARHGCMRHVRKTTEFLMRTPVTYARCVLLKTADCYSFLCTRFVTWN